jgi:ADP-ribose pyrophosphatase YjhB (NUDIX family)
METTRHFTATTYVVADGAVALHEHDGLGKWLPPGGHVDRDELPHEAALREISEETGLNVDLVAEQGTFESPTVDPLPEPQHLLLADVNVHGDVVGHQHVDFVYFARADTREISPADGEQPADDWAWFAPADLADERVDSDVEAIGCEAIDAVDE